MKARFSLSVMVCVGVLCGCSERPQAPPTEAAASTQVAQANTATPPAAQPAPAVHGRGGAGPMPGAGPGALPPGHPPLPGQEPAPTPGLPAGHPPIGGGAAMGGAPMGGAAMPSHAAIATDEHELPLPLEGISSVQEMTKQLEGLPDAEARARFEYAFRLTFTTARDKRDARQAATLLGELAEKYPQHAGIYRTRGYVHIDGGFKVDAALADYRKAVELDPNYGEAHYALAFTYAIRDKEKGKVHYDRAMELGIPDSRGIGRQFYDAPAEP